jgi:predicted transcriptional regulator
MSSTTKTTIYLDASDYRRLQAIARSEGRPAAELVREAVSAYVSRLRPGARPASIGVGHSGRGDLSERAEELLAGLGREA